MKAAPLSDEQIRLIFGLKIKQLRTQKNLSLLGLSKLSGLSKSYLNEIEKGKKYPKTDKVLTLSESLDCSYEDLVSTKLSGTMAPVAEIIMSGILKEIPLELFGIEENHLLDIISSAPQKVTAFIGTIFDIARSYNLSRENFYLAALRSYQESNFNHFKDLEDEVEKFASRHQLDINTAIETSDLTAILNEEYGIEVSYSGLEEFSDVDQIRSVFHPKGKTLYVAKKITEQQKRFILAKELGYQHLQIKQRPLTFSWIKFSHFEEVLNNFKASYFAGALLISQNPLVDDLHAIFSQNEWSNEALYNSLNKHSGSAETYFQRLTNVLSAHFKLKKLFFLRFERHKDKPDIHLTKELHLSKSHNPHAIQSDEHYCRRWVSTNILLEPAHYKKHGNVRVGAQISNYPQMGNKHFIITASDLDPFNENKVRSVCIGIELDGKQDKRLNFLKDQSIVEKDTNFTCERCGFQDCESRVAPAKIFNKKAKHSDLEERVARLLNSLD